MEADAAEEEVEHVGLASELFRGRSHLDLLAV